MAHGDGLIVQKISERLAGSELVGSAVVLALDGVINQNGQLDLDLTESYIPNDFLAREAAKYDNLYFGASVNPYRHDALERLDQVKRDGAVLVKFVPVTVARADGVQGDDRAFLSHRGVGENPWTRSDRVAAVAAE